MTREPHPFGPPAVPCTARSTVLKLHGVAPPHVAYERLRSRRRGLALLETGSEAEPALPTARHSFVLARSLLRLVLREGSVRARALEAAGAPLLPLLAARTPGAALVD